MAGPKDIIQDSFTPILIAYWFMNDGFYEKWDKTYYFCTESFTKDEVLFLIHLLSKYNIKAGTKIRYNSLKQHIGYRIRLSRHSVYTFHELVKPYILPIYTYKLG